MTGSACPRWMLVYMLVASQVNKTDVVCHFHWVSAFTTVVESVAT